MKDLRKDLEKIINEPLVREKYGKCPHCSFKTKSYITHKNNSIAKHIITNHFEVPDKIDKLLSLFKQQMKDKIEEIEKLGDWEEDKDYGLIISHKDWKAFRKELLKNIEEF